MSEMSFWERLQIDESRECGFAVPYGRTYCRECGGRGGPVEDPLRQCEECDGRGDHQNPEFDGGESA